MSTGNKETANNQTHSHGEGPQKNTPVNTEGGQKKHQNNSQLMSNMKTEPEEQKRGRAHGQTDESGVQQEERLP